MATPSRRGKKRTSPNPILIFESVADGELEQKTTKIREGRNGMKRERSSDRGGQVSRHVLRIAEDENRS